MASVNKVFVLGNLGRDPEMRYTADGAAIASFSVATSRKWKDAGGELQEETEWHRMVAFGRTAEIAGEYLKKGSSVHIDGRLKTRKWTDKDGVEKYTTEIVVEQLTMVGRPPAGDDHHGGQQSRSARAPQTRTARPAAPANTVADMDDDIPF